jgi:hypothetical protein
LYGWAVLCPIRLYTHISVQLVLKDLSWDGLKMQR